MLSTYCIVAAFLATASARMTSWDIGCGSKFDRIDTTSLSMTSEKGTFEAGDTVTIDTSGTCNLHGPFMGGSWSVRVYEEGFAHPVGDFAGDFADVLSFPDAKNTTFKIEGVKFALPKSGGENIFQIAFTAQDFSHATYFCVDIFYNLHTGKVVKMMKKEAPTVALMQQEKTAEPLLGSCETDADCPSSYCKNDPTKHAPYQCHLCGDECCAEDTDCPGSYCKNDPTKMPPYFCHGSAHKEKSAVAVAVAVAAPEIDCATFGCYCKANGYCHVPPQPDTCTEDSQCRSPWYPTSYCQHQGSCHMELPPRCLYDSDCKRGLDAVAAPVATAVVATERSALNALTNGTLDTNVCGVNWYYCPRDPGCVTYTMSAHDVVVHANNYGTDPVLMDTLKIGNSMTIQVSGVTTIEKVPVAGSYRIYGVNGKNVATGILTDTLVINYNKATLQYDFVMTVTFVLDANNFDVAMKWTEWTLDVFQEKSGSDEGMCVEFSSIEYVNYLQTKQDPPFVDLCVDRGDGTFENQTIAITTALDTLHVTSPPGCVEKCNLKWNWCPRDPGCKTYTMDVASVETDVKGATEIKAGDSFTVTVRGTTTLSTVPVAGSYRIYALAGGNAAAGVLTDVLTIDRGTFVMVIPFTATAACFNLPKNWFEFGIDVFQKGSGSDEGMCIEITNPTYNSYEFATTSHQAYVTDCDMSKFPFVAVAGGVREVEHDVMCKFIK
jgi:hypothetical protein